MLQPGEEGGDAIQSPPVELLRQVIDVREQHVDQRGDFDPNVDFFTGVGRAGGLRRYIQLDSWDAELLVGNGDDDEGMDRPPLDDAKLTALIEAAHTRYNMNNAHPNNAIDDDNYDEMPELQPVRPE